MSRSRSAALRRCLNQRWKYGSSARTWVADGVGDVEQRPERTRRVQRVARAPQDAPALDERADQRGLADARLAADQDEPARRAGEHVENGQQHEEI
jgi:hypothetical protein